MAGQAPDIDDRNPCTSDSCDPQTGAVHLPVAEGSSCSDDNVCNGEESCDASGQCAAGTPPVLDDGNACTFDDCYADTGVRHRPIAVDDGDACTIDSCDPSSGVTHQQVNIDDSNPCTADSCHWLLGVSHVLLSAGASCSDGNSCNGEETCSASGQCMATGAPQLDDFNACTIDSCDSAAGVIAHTPRPAGSSCTDGDVCNGEETCSPTGECLAGVPLAVMDDGNPGTLDYCDPVAGVKHAQSSAVDPTVVTSLFTASAFLYTGPDAIQRGVVPGTIQQDRVAVLRGQVLDRAGAPIQGVDITVLGHPELGTTRSQANGWFDIVVNGGGFLTLRYSKSGLLSVQRQVLAGLRNGREWIPW